MNLGRNDKCPCGSGKKFKYCCINDDKYTRNRLNNGIPRKYMSEFALHTYSSQVAITYPTNLGQFDVSNANYHIYMINKIRRLGFVKDSIKMLSTHIEVQIQHGVTQIDNIETIKIPLDKGIIDCEIESDKMLFFKNGHGGGVKIDVLTLHSDYSTEDLICEVLYVGQSYGKKGNRDALTRLESHETLQKILADILHDDINFEIAITLWEFTPCLISSVYGSNGFLATEQEDIQHTEKVLSNHPLIVDNQIINVTEAALINYFKPKYNSDFVNNFPDIKHKGYTFYYDYDYNAIAVELDPSCIKIEIHSQHTGYSQFRPIEYLLNSAEKRRSMFVL